MLVKAMLMIVFVIPIITLCTYFVCAAERMQNAEVQDDR